MAENEVKIQTPKKLNAVNISQFLHIANAIFSWEDKRIPNFTFDTSTTEKADIIGLLLIYKFYEYTVHKSCFSKPKSIIKGYVGDELQKYGLKKLVDHFIKYNEPQYDSLQFKSTDALFISPILLKRDSPIDEVSVAGKDICTYYLHLDKVQYLVLTAMGELAQNFKSHASSDTTSILSVTGTKHSFEIACVDTGDGIITTLHKNNNKYTKVPPTQTLLKALEKGVTSKDVSSGHMGYGLWLIKELVVASKGELHIHSEGYYLRIHNKRIKAGQSPYWKGTIVYMQLPLIKSEELFNLLLAMRPRKMQIKLRKV